MEHDQTFVKASAFTLLAEGPMSDNAIDPGGLTKFGISAKNYPTLDVANISREQALDIYYTDYWLRCYCNQLPYPFALAMFECAVNQGQGTALRCLQAAIGVTPDGVFGPQSQRALLLVKSQPRVLASFLALRVQRYVAIKDSNPELYAADNKGWFTRLFLCTMAGYEE